jgi:N-acetylglucosaminyldiphosphoundecaprenol N-acetyl-beta-D-mannosaminyltransferase
MSGAVEPVARAGRVRIGHLWIDALRFDEALDAIESLVRSGRGGSVFTPNVDHVVIAESDAAFRAAYAAASLSLADGQPLVWAARLLGTRIPEKISGSDLVWPLLERAAKAGWRVYLLGSTPEVARAAADRMASELGLTVVGTDSSRITLDEAGSGDHPTIARIEAARPDLVLVALGAPKQELWIHQAAPRLRPAVAVGVGASLDFIAGTVRRAPRWMSRAGLEWLFRLVQEPRRLAYRYLWKDPAFLLVLVRTAFTPRARRLLEAGRAPDTGRSP